jgi:hypothetical protein
LCIIGAGQAWCMMRGCCIALLIQTIRDCLGYRGSVASAVVFVFVWLHRPVQKVIKVWQLPGGEGRANAGKPCAQALLCAAQAAFSPAWSPLGCLLQPP